MLFTEHSSLWPSKRGFCGRSADFVASAVQHFADLLNACVLMCALGSGVGAWHGFTQAQVAVSSFQPILFELQPSYLARIQLGIHVHTAFVLLNTLLAIIDMSHSTRYASKRKSSSSSGDVFHCLGPLAGIILLNQKQTDPQGSAARAEVNRSE